MTVNHHQLPSVKSLQMFVTAARTLNFAAAADELCVSPAAVSQRMRSLEALLNVKLFARTGRTVRLTDAGLRWLPQVRECLEVYAKTVDLVAICRKDRLSITVAPSFASRWLMGRLDKFSELAPEVNVRVIATPEVMDLWDDKLDLAIRYGPGDYPGLTVTSLMPEYLLPMCSPKLLERGPALETPADIVKYPLIHDESTTINGGAWRLWFMAAGIKNANADAGIKFTLADLALRSAIDARGIVLGRQVLAKPELEAGRLVCPFDLRVESPYRYFIVIRPGDNPAPQITQFSEWLLNEAAGMTLR